MVRRSSGPARLRLPAQGRALSVAFGMFEWLTAGGALKPFFDGVLQGAGITFYTSSLGFLFGLALGVVLLVLRASGGSVARALVIVYVSAMRGTPLLIQLLIAY